MDCKVKVLPLTISFITIAITEYSYLIMSLEDSPDDRSDALELEMTIDDCDSFCREITSLYDDSSIS